jgi:hypothetical protein
MEWPTWDKYTKEQILTFPAAGVSILQTPDGRNIHPVEYANEFYGQDFAATIERMYITGAPPGYATPIPSTITPSLTPVSDITLLSERQAVSSGLLDETAPVSQESMSTMGWLALAGLAFWLWGKR